jgi:hypothetical protein
MVFLLPRSPVEASDPWEAMAELHTSESHAAFLSGGGEMGERIRVQSAIAERHAIRRDLR